MNAIQSIESLETRRLLSTITADADGRPIFINDAGVTYPLPYVNSQGQLRVDGTEAPDNLLIENRIGTDPATASQYAEGGLMVGMLIQYDDIFPWAEQKWGQVFGALTVENWEESTAGSMAELERAEAALASLLNRPAGQEASQAAIDDAHVRFIAQERYTRFAQRALDNIRNGALTRVQMPGVYDMYVPNSLLSEVRVSSGGGNDIVSASANVRAKVRIDGGSGSDKITSGKSNAILYGGSGNDKLISRSVKGGTLDGGKGADRYYNRGGEVNIAVREDGDRLVIGDRTVNVAKSGVFGTSRIDSRSYFLVSGVAGQIDLLA